MVFSNSFTIQWGSTGNIPKAGGLIIQLPTSYSTRHCAVCGDMIDLSTVGDSRLMILQRTLTIIDVDWTNYEHTDRINWISVGF